jgi:RNA polymerase sigma-70 factor (sigma-E family)
MRHSIGSACRPTTAKICGKPNQRLARPHRVTAEQLISGRVMARPPVAVEWDADAAVTHLFTAHYRPMVRLASLLLHERGMAEEIVQDAYVALHGRWRQLRDSDKALAYLRATVVNRCRSALRHRKVVEAHLAAARPPLDAPSAEAGALELLAHDTVIMALRRLPARQREAIVLRYYADLSEADIAETMGVSRGAVKSHTSRGMAALRQALRELS